MSLAPATMDLVSIRTSTTLQNEGEEGQMQRGTHDVSDSDNCCWRVCKCISKNLFTTIAKVTLLIILGVVSLWWIPSIAPVFFAAAGGIVATYLVVKAIDRYDISVLKGLKLKAGNLDDRCSWLPWMGYTAAALLCLASGIAGIAMAALFGIYHGVVLIMKTASVNQSIAARTEQEPPV